VPSDERAGGMTIALGAAVCFASCLGLWVLLVGGVDPEDMIAGALSAAAATVAGWFATDRGRAIPELRPRDGGDLVRLVPRVISESASVYAAAARHATGRPIGARTRLVRTDVRGGGWPGARRAALLGALGSFGPGRIVIELDTETGDALVHELTARPKP